MRRRDKQDGIGANPVLDIQEFGAFWHGDDRPRLDGPNQMALRWRQLPARRPP
jgi:hypothetical protein